MVPEYGPLPSSNGSEVPLGFMGYMMGLKGQLLRAHTEGPCNDFERTSGESTA